MLVVTRGAKTQLMSLIDQNKPTTGHRGFLSTRDQDDVILSSLKPSRGTTMMPCMVDEKGCGGSCQTLEDEVGLQC